MVIEKIIDLDDFERFMDTRNTTSSTIVMTYGSYETLHVGHIRHLRKAREFGDILIVVLSSDQDIPKGGLPVPELLRAEALAHLDCVDGIVLQATLRQAFETIRPDIYATGEYDLAQADEALSLCQELGIQTQPTDTRTFDSTLGINQFLARFGEEVHEYLEQFRLRFSFEQIQEVIENMAKLRVAVIGDTIIDEYCYCDTLGVSSKDPILSMRYRSRDLFAGGILAVANHVMNFAGEVDLFTVIGEQDNYLDFICSKINNNIKKHFVTQDDSPTVRKRRYIEGYTQNKIFEIYFMDDAGLSAARDAELRNAISSKLKSYDLVIVADFGHGAISQDMRRMLERDAQFLAANAQANSGNRGFHTISKYNRADFVSIAEHEMRLEMRDMRGSIRHMIDILAPRLSCSNFIVTRGKRGSTIRGGNGKHITVPAFAKGYVDRIGAGDAFLSIAALAARLGTPPELICFIGNIVGALAVEILGNQKAIDKAGVTRYAASLLGFSGGCS